MISLLVAGGISLAAPVAPFNWPDINNHTLRGEVIPSSQVVTRNRWGTPMLPDGKGGYSLIAPINPEFIQQSLIIPPRTTNMVAFRPLPPVDATVDLPASAPVSAPAVTAPVAPEAAPVEAALPAGDTLPAAAPDAAPAAAPAADSWGTPQ